MVTEVLPCGRAAGGRNGCYGRRGRHPIGIEARPGPGSDRRRHRDIDDSGRVRRRHRGDGGCIDYRHDPRILAK